MLLQVRCSTRDGSAKSGSDYEPKSRLLRFRPGDTSVSFEVSFRVYRLFVGSYQNGYRLLQNIFGRKRLICLISNGSSLALNCIKDRSTRQESSTSSSFLSLTCSGVNDNFVRLFSTIAFGKV